ncbi:MAG: SUMF1/EgtB/PvdO family nonheme iron enzyme, partial [Opitutales bacterium]
MKLFLACFGALVLGMGLPVRAAATIEHTDVRYENGFLTIVFSNADAQANLYALEASADLISTDWAEVSGATFTTLDATHLQVRVPVGSVDHEFYRILGTFLSGAPAGLNQITGGTRGSASSLGELTVETFFLGESEVTWGEWRSVAVWAAAHGYDLASVGAGCADSHPVSSVSWYDVVKWCNARSEEAGLRPVYRLGTEIYRSGESTPSIDATADGYRLPTEAEWEFAAIGGAGALVTTYSGGDDLDAVGWYAGNASGAACDLSAGAGTWPVGQKAANDAGQQDMSGNIAEWCWDAAGSGRRVRGGSWADDAAACALAARAEAAATTRSDTIGFRLARNLSPYAASTLPLIALITPNDLPLAPADVFVIGDSTVASYGASSYPQRGWGQELPHFLTSDAFVVQNRAIGGRSSRSFIEEGRWESVKSSMSAGDYLLIQFGHNDRDWTKAERYTPTEDYKTYLTTYVTEAREVG